MLIYRKKVAKGIYHKPDFAVKVDPEPVSCYDNVNKLIRSEIKRRP